MSMLYKNCQECASVNWCVCACEKRITAHRDRCSCRRHKKNVVYTFFNFFFFFFLMTNDFGMAQQEDFLPPNANPCCAEESEDLWLVKQ